MFGNGNNQAMQFMMQGYSDSIKTYDDQSAGNLMKNINGLTNSYFQNESSIQNTEAQRLSNHFNRENMQTALDKEKALLKHQQLSNQYDEKSMNDRLGIVSNENQLGKVNVQYAKGVVDKNIDAQNALSQTTIDTAKSETNRINAENYAATSLANLNNTKTKLTQQNYDGIPDYVINGKHYAKVIDDGKGGKIGVNEYTPEQLKIVQDHNNQIEINKQKHRAVDTSSNQAAVEGNMALEAQSKVAANAANIQKQQQDRLNELMQKTNTDDLQLQQNYIAAVQNGSNFVQLADGSAIPLETAQARLFAQGIFQPNRYSQNVNLSGELGLGIKNTDKRLQAQRFNQMNNPENDPDKKLYIDYYHGGDTSKRKIADSNINLVVKNDNLLQDINSIMNDSNRVQLWLGGLQQFAPSIFGSKASASTALANYVESDQIITGMKDITGAASDRDAKKLQEKTTDLFKKNDAYNNQITYALNRQKLQKYEEIMRGLGDTKLTGKSLEAIYGKQFMDDYIATRAIVEIGSEYFPNNSRLK